MKPRLTPLFPLAVASCAALFAAQPAAAAVPAPARPNIVLILADDIGYGDIGCQGGRHARTPNLDRLARDGMRFTDAHSPASTCSPSRRALLTGVYSWRQQPGSSIMPGDAPLSIPVGSPTLPSLLKQAGYRTGVVGKWHLGLGLERGRQDWNGELAPGPLEIGFDYCFLIPATGDRVPTVFVENHRVVGLDPRDPLRVDYDKKIGDEPTGRENPELLKLKATRRHDNTIVNGVGRLGWMSGGHSARWKDEDIADTLAQKAITFIGQGGPGPFFLYLATHDIHVPRIPNRRFVGTSPVGTRGDAIQQLDDTVGQVLAALERLQLADNTLVIFSSDNGGVMDDGYADVGRNDYKPNAPLRGGKNTLFEGGHRVPFLARWPGHIAPGATSDALLTLIDLPATLAALTGAAVPAGGCRDSVNVLPVLLGRTTVSPRETFVAHNGGTNPPFGLRVGPWKLIAPGGQTKPPQLFNLADDLGEQHDLAADPGSAAKLRELTARLDQLTGREEKPSP